MEFLWQTRDQLFQCLPYEESGINKPAQKLTLAVALLLLAGALVAALWLQREGETSAIVIDCDLLDGRCEFDTSQGLASLELSPLPISSAAPFQLSVSYPGDAPDSIWIDLQGKEMYMGVNQVNLVQQGSLWQAEANLGICTTGTMRWVLNLILEQSDGQEVYQFEFDAR